MTILMLARTGDSQPPASQPASKRPKSALDCIRHQIAPRGAKSTTFAQAFFKHPIVENSQPPSQPAGQPAQPATQRHPPHPPHPPHPSYLPHLVDPPSFLLSSSSSSSSYSSFLYSNASSTHATRFGKQISRFPNDSTSNELCPPVSIISAVATIHFMPNLISIKNLFGDLALGSCDRVVRDLLCVTCRA